MLHLGDDWVEKRRSLHETLPDKTGRTALPTPPQSQNACVNSRALRSLCVLGILKGSWGCRCSDVPAYWEFIAGYEAPHIGKGPRFSRPALKSFRAKVLSASDLVGWVYTIP